ncbi:MAG: exbD 1 [Acidobacteria bacterium]|nr:exbD 1 [Acidobacteriota bacterium]
MPKLGPAVSSASGRAGRGRRVMTSLAEINVVPLVDVMLVLLIIFMVAAPMIQRGIDVKLPQSRRATSVTGERVEITLPDSIRRDAFVFVGKQQVKLKDLQEIVRQRMEGSATKEVFLRGDSSVQYQDLMNVIDALKAAGVQNIGMVARMPSER